MTESGHPSFLNPGLIQRHQDYVLGPNQDPRLASVAAGASLSCVLQLDSDAPFILRSRAMRCGYDPNNLDLPNLDHVLLRWTGPRRDYRSQDFVRQSLVAPYFGLLGNPIPVSPEIFYPRQSSIEVDIINDGAAAITNLTFYFRGVKLFQPGVVKAYTYPAKFGGLPFVYPQLQVNDVPVATSGPIRYTFRVKADADFVIRGGQSPTIQADTFVLEAFITLRDEDEKPYSNDGVHMDVMFGTSHFGSSFLFAGNDNAPIGGGPNSPGLFYPEIYIPKNHLIYFDITRNDTFAAGAGAVADSIPFSFIGQKVFEK